MITISLQQIKDYGPNAQRSLWTAFDKLVRDKGGVVNDEPFPLVDALESNTFEEVLQYIACLPEHHNLWSQYALWCAKHVEHFPLDDRSRMALIVAHRYLCGASTKNDLWGAMRGAEEAAYDAKKSRKMLPRSAICAAQAIAWAASAVRESGLAAQAAHRTEANVRAQHAATEAVEAALAAVEAMQAFTGSVLYVKFIEILRS